MPTRKEISKFLNKICLELGICSPFYNLEHFLFREHYEVDKFVREIFLAEGLDPDLELKLFRQTKKMFTERFGSEIYPNK